MRPLASFCVTVRGLTVRVRVLADVQAVDRARNGGRASRNGRTVQGFLEYSLVGRSRPTMTLPLAGWTPGIVAHECVHVAVLAGRAADVAHDDEPLAYAVQSLTDAICRRMRKLEAARACA